MQIHNDVTSKFSRDSNIHLKTWSKVAEAKKKTYKILVITSRTHHASAAETRWTRTHQEMQHYISSL